ncbi:response regulator transcription factor [Paenibacillus paridis]|uniref:response regulator transcription factor n=1 Tax=Paenibacillus paridis TaxID=2583376 RepID=UPI00111DF857|nr:response regulator [Paenibacillus paridis]
MIRVLLVDDSPLIRESLSQSVEEAGDLTVVSGTAANGEKALTWLDSHYADLCITDIRMPVMDGLTLIERINERYPWMMCLVVSSYDDFEYAKTSIQLKALDYILKPVDNRLLNRTLVAAEGRINQERSRDAASIMLRKLPHHRSFLERWLNQVRTLQTGTMPLLIVDTLELLESWIGHQYYLLNALSDAWLQMLIEELMEDKLRLELKEGKDLVFGERTLPISEIRSHFRLCAVQRLEEGSHQLVAAMRGVRDTQTMRKIELVKQYIREHFTKDINLQELAEQVDMNKTYMCTLFKQETGITVWNYIVAERMQKARSLLLETSFKVYEIANEIGYEDVPYFSQNFKKYYGMTPLDYKRRMKS